MKGVMDLLLSLQLPKMQEFLVDIKGNMKSPALTNMLSFPFSVSTIHDGVVMIQLITR